ncbi:MAG: ApaG domain [Verrucomicrobiae bacterium]|nr:ApaG domain [Verrucomicrobiae bacterium]
MEEASNPPIELPGLRVTVDRVLYHAEAQTPADRPHCFVYFITIHNDSETPVTIVGRKWVVRGDDGQIAALEGDGVVGKTPLVLPGDQFSYNSFHLMQTESAVAEGAYLGVDADGRRVFTRIPAFRMTVPKAGQGRV